MAKKKKEARQVITLECTEARIGQITFSLLYNEEQEEHPKAFGTEEVQPKPSSPHHSQRNQVNHFFCVENPSLGWGFLFYCGGTLDSSLWAVWTTQIPRCTCQDTIDAVTTVIRYDCGESVVILKSVEQFSVVCDRQGVLWSETTRVFDRARHSYLCDVTQK